MESSITMYKTSTIRTIGLLLASALTLMVTSCSERTLDGAMTECSFTVAVEPEIYTRGVTPSAETLVADRCVMELFYQGESAGQYLATLEEGNAKFDISVVAERSYDIVFWADKTGCYDIQTLKSISFPESGYDFADNSMDAFYAVFKDVAVTQERFVANATLHRALAKVCVTNAGGKTITLSAPSSFNPIDDTFGTVRSCSYSNPTLFLFAPEEKSYININIGDTECNSVPIQRNFKTNIVIH